ncbi:metallophosphoesterase family protein [bacterium]|nr:metallophosphoesterase family protein [bacterium]
MKIMAITDLHGDVGKIAKATNEISAVDLVLLVGDTTFFGRSQDILDIIEIISRINPRILVVPGNCDFPETEEALNQIGLSISSQYKIIEGKAFVGLGASLATPSGGTPYEVTDEHLGEQLKKAVLDLQPDIPMILVSHQPPINTSADDLGNGVHVGSSKVREFIESRTPLICFTGHIHEGIGIDSIGDTKIINPGPMYEERYAYAEISDKVDTLEIRSIY